MIIYCSFLPPRGYCSHRSRKQISNRHQKLTVFQNQLTCFPSSSELIYTASLSPQLHPISHTLLFYSWQRLICYLIQALCLLLHNHWPGRCFWRVKAGCERRAYAGKPPATRYQQLCVSDGQEDHSSRGKDPLLHIKKTKRETHTQLPLCRLPLPLISISTGNLGWSPTGDPQMHHHCCHRGPEWVPSISEGVQTCTESCISEATLPAGHSHNLQVTTSLALLSSLKVTHKCSEVQEKQAVLFSYK